MNLATVGVQRATHADLIRQMTAQLALPCEKNSAGRERAKLATTLTAGRLDDAARRLLLRAWGPAKLSDRIQRPGRSGLARCPCGGQRHPGLSGCVVRCAKNPDAGPGATGIDQGRLVCRRHQPHGSHQGMLIPSSHAMIAQVEGQRCRQPARAVAGRRSPGGHPVGAHAVHAHHARLAS